MQVRLTDKLVGNLTAEPGQRIEVPDDLQRGLRIRVTDKGHKTWSVQRRIGGRKRRFTIGPYPEISLAEARQRAARLIIKAEDGYDPVEEKRKQRAERGHTTKLTLDNAIEMYAQQVRGNSRYQREKVGTLRRELSHLLAEATEDVSHLQLVAVLDRKAQSAPIAANRLMSALKVFCKWMALRGLTSTDLATTLTKVVREQPRDRVLTLEEVSEVWEAAGQLGHPFGPVVKLLILTAQRRSEVASMRWEEVDFANKLWTIPGERTKNGQPHLVPLSEPAMEVLREVASLQGVASGQGLVFTTTGDTPPSGFSRAKHRLDELSGNNNWRLHDLRRTVVSHMADRGVDPLVADRILNHVASSTLGTVQRTYQKSQMLPQRRIALEKWGNLLKERIST